MQTNAAIGTPLWQHAPAGQAPARRARVRIHSRTHKHRTYLELLEHSVKHNQAYDTCRAWYAKHTCELAAGQRVHKQGARVATEQLQAPDAVIQPACTEVNWQELRMAFATDAHTHLGQRCFRRQEQL